MENKKVDYLNVSVRLFISEIIYFLVMIYIIREVAPITIEDFLHSKIIFHYYLNRRAKNNLSDSFHLAVVEGF